LAPDWSYTRDHVERRSERKPGSAGIRVVWADEAYLDPDALTLDPDPASTSGRSARTIGFSESAGFAITVITVVEAGRLWGVNAWKSNESDRARYEKGVR
jgi:hypothetical protein